MFTRAYPGRLEDLKKPEISSYDEDASAPSAVSSISLIVSHCPSSEVTGRTVLTRAELHLNILGLWPTYISRVIVM